MNFETESSRSRAFILTRKATFHKALGRRVIPGPSEMALDREGVCHSCGLGDAPKKRQDDEPFLMSKENHIDPGVIPNCLSNLTQREEVVVAKAHCHMITKRFRGHQYHYTGHCVCFWQRTITFRDVMPVLPWKQMLFFFDRRMLIFKIKLSAHHGG